MLSASGSVGSLALGPEGPEYPELPENPEYPGKPETSELAVAVWAAMTTHSAMHTYRMVHALRRWKMRYVYMALCGGEPVVCGRVMVRRVAGVTYLL